MAPVTPPIPTPMQVPAMTPSRTPEPGPGSGRVEGKRGEFLPNDAGDREKRMVAHASIPTYLPICVS